MQPYLKNGYTVTMGADDLHVCDLKDRGHREDALRSAFSQGVRFICLACIGAYAVTDKGFIDVEKGQIIDPILETIA